VASSTLSEGNGEEFQTCFPGSAHGGDALTAPPGAPSQRPGAREDQGEGNRPTAEDGIAANVGGPKHVSCLPPPGLVRLVSAQWPRRHGGRSVARGGAGRQGRREVGEMPRKNVGLVAHLLWEQGAGGSNPLTPTIVSSSRRCAGSVPRLTRKSRDSPRLGGGPSVEGPWPLGLSGIDSRP
jgi:hypothetical protein